MRGLRGGPPNTQPALVDARLVDEMLIIFDLARRLALAPVMHGRKKRRAKAAARRLLPGRFVHHNAALARTDDYGTAVRTAAASFDSGAHSANSSAAKRPTTQNAVTAMSSPSVTTATN